jgi:hypothetical protein
MVNSKNSGNIFSASEGGVAGKHPDPDGFEFFAAPATSGEFNTARLRLIPVACWRVDDVRFAFDSSFVTPDISTELQILMSVRDAHKKEEIAPQKTEYPPMSVFGHADPVGTDDYNKALSGRRAAAIYALLISNTDSSTALRMWNSIAVAEGWGTQQRQTMQAATGLQPGTPDDTLRKAYMAKLSPPELQLTRQDFLAQGVDPLGKGDYQGCSEFNPVLIFSQQKNSKFEQASDKSERNAANAPNRRVVVMLFRPGSQVIPGKWPCPRANEGVAGCRLRFWSDGEARRSTRLAAADRAFESSGDTFACRFYNRLATGSPCESLRTSGECFVFLKLFDDNLETILANQEYELVGLTLGWRTRSKTKADGIVRHESIPDDHYLLLCGGQTEPVEVYYMVEKDRYDGKPWFMRVRGIKTSNGNGPAQSGDL